MSVSGTYFPPYTPPYLPFSSGRFKSRVNTRSGGVITALILVVLVVLLFVVFFKRRCVCSDVILEDDDDDFEVHVFPHTLELRADKNDADVVAIAYKKNTPSSFAFVFLRLCRGKNKQYKQSQRVLLMRTLSRVFISDYVDVFPKRRKERVLGFWLS